VRNGRHDRPVYNNPLFLLGAAAVLLLGTGLACSPVRVVDEGHVGLVTRFGRARDVRPPGLTVVNPVTERLLEVETRVRPITFTGIDAGSQELQSVKLTGTLNYALDSAKVVELYRTVGLDFQARVLNAALHSTAKAVLPQYPVNSILASREQISAQIQERLNVELKDYGIVVTNIFLEDISFSPEFQKAIEEKQTAAQNAEKEKQVLEQRRQQALQAVAVAEGEAQAAVKRAEGQAEANRLLAASLTPAVLEDKRLSKWDGKLPTVTGSGGTLVNVGP
jgi:prohibitin 1